MDKTYTKRDINAVIKLLSYDQRTKAGKEYREKHFPGVSREEVVDSRKKMREGLEEIKKIYRSTLIYSYHVREGRYSVWVYTEEPNITKPQMFDKLNDLFAKQPTNMQHALSEEKWEDNEKVEPDERPTSQDMDTFYGKVEFVSKGGVKKIYPLSGVEDLGG